MNKLFTKIAGVALGLTMAIGVGVAVTNKKEVKPSYATDATITLDSIGNNLGSTANTTASTTDITATGTTDTYTLNYYQCKKQGSAILMTKSVSPYISNHTAIPGDIKSVEIFTPSGASSKTTYNVRCSTNEISSESGGTAIGTASTLSVPGSKVYYNYENSAYKVSGARYFVININNANNGQISKIVITYVQPAGTASVTNVAVNNDMTKKSYNTFDSDWDRTGLTANVTMSDSSSYSGNVSWSFNPTTPLAYVKTNLDDVSNGTIRVTATAGGQSGYKDVTGINVSCGTVAQATANTPASGTKEAIVKGIVSQINEVSTANGNATYFISDDGTTTGQYEVYRGKYVGNVNFTNTNQLKVGDIVVVYGNLKTYNSTKEFDSNNYLLSLERPVSSDPEVTITEADFTIHVGDTDVTLHETHQNLPEGGYIKWSSATPAVATVGQTNGVVHAVSAGTAQISATIFNSNDQSVNSNNITVTVVDEVLADGDSFVIYYGTSGSEIYFSGITDGNIGSYSSNEEDALVFTAVESATARQFALEFGGNYLSYSGSDNKIYSSGTNNTNATLWTVVTNGSVDIIESVNVAGRHVRYNSTSGQERFCCYTSAPNVHVRKIVVPDPTTLTMDTKTLTLDAEEVSEALTFTTDSPSSAFSWYSEDTSKATVSNGVVTAGTQTGVTVKIYVYFDTDGSGDFDPSEDLNDYCTVTISVPSIDYTSVTFGGTGVKITSSNASTYLVSGKKIIITYDDSVVAGAYNSSKNYYEETDTSVTFNSSNVVVGDGTAEVSIAVFELESSTNGFYLKLKDGKYLGNGSTSTKAGDFKRDAEATTEWVVSADGIYDYSNEDYATILYNTQNPRFKTYATSFSNGSPITLYSFNEYIDEAEDYADLFLASSLCGSNDNTKASSSVWATLQGMFEDDLSVGAQNVLKNAVANKDSTDSIQKCLAKYDRVIYLHFNAEPTSYPDFMDRVANDFVVPMQGSRSINVLGQNNTTVIIVVVSMISLVSAGAFFFLRRRKEQ